MAKRRNLVADYIVYLLVRVVVCIVQALSWRLAFKLADGLAWLAYRLDRRHRQVARENLEHAFSELDEPARNRLVRAVYRHFATIAIEMIRMPRVLYRSTLDNFVRYADPADLERVLGWIRSGRPLMVLTGHFGNWEILGYATGLFGCRGGVVARRLDNPHLDRFLLDFRRKTGLTLLDKNVDYPRILDILANRGSLGMVGDQDAGARGLFVNFLGRPASTFKSIALLSLEYSAPVLVLGAARMGDPMQYRLYLEDVILPEEHATHADAARLITQRYTEALERMIRRHPEQYFWLHRRWKHQPQARKSKKAA
jgi:KDO2-lipid IV(A) lauroyltransferase